jgi:hypothetical protein
LVWLLRGSMVEEDDDGGSSEALHVRLAKRVTQGLWSMQVVRGRRDQSAAPGISHFLDIRSSALAPLITDHHHKLPE